MCESALQSTIEQLADEAVAYTGFDKVAYAIEFTRRVDQRFPVSHPQRFQALQLAKHAGYFAADWVMVEA